MKIKSIFLAVILSLGFLIYSLNFKAENLEVYFLDVGQGDAILIRTPEGQNIVIDGGPDNFLLYELGQSLPWWDRTIDYLVISHYHADHYMGFPELLKKYKVKNILVTAHEPDDLLYSVWQGVLAEYNLDPTIVEVGETFVVNDELSWQVLLADDSHEDFNDNSLVVRLSYNEVDFLFMGDLPISGEEKLLSLGFDLKSEVLKVGHHGSKYSSGEAFLAAVEPKICVIQAGIDNKFNHPHKEAIERLKQVNCQVENTQDKARFKIISDGKNLSVY